MELEKALEFALDQASLERSPATARAYRMGANTFRRFLSENGVPDDIDTNALDINLFIRFPSWLLRNYTRVTAGVYMAGVKYIWKWMMIEDWIHPDYNHTVRLEKAIETARFGRQQRRLRTPAKGHLEKMLDALALLNEPPPRQERDRALLLFLATSGVRNAEATHLTVKDIDLDARQAFIIDGKGEKDRLAFFSQAAADALRAYWTARGFDGKTDPAFCRHDKGVGKRHRALTPTTVRNIVDTVSALAGLEKGAWTPHSFRHAFAITSITETGNLALVQDLLGHSNPNTTRIYADIYEDDLRAAHRRIFK